MDKKPKTVVLIAALLSLSIMGNILAARQISRVYLGVHWPTEVIAAWSAGILWVMLCCIFVTWLEPRNAAVRSPSPGGNKLS